MPVTGTESSSALTEQKSIDGRGAGDLPQNTQQPALLLQVGASSTGETTHFLTDRPKQHVDPSGIAPGRAASWSQAPLNQKREWKEFVSCWRCSPNQESPAPKDDTFAFRSCV